MFKSDSKDRRAYPILGKKLREFLNKKIQSDNNLVLLQKYQQYKFDWVVEPPDFLLMRKGWKKKRKRRK